MNVWRVVLLAGSTFCVALSSMAAELQVIAGGGIAAPLREIAAQFEKTTGHRLVIRYGTVPELIKMATGGPFDLGVVPVDVLNNDAARATFAAGASPEVARVGIGVAGRAEARHQHARRVETDAAQRQVDRIDTRERNGLPSRTHLRAPWYHGSDKGEDQAAGDIRADR